MNRKQGLHYITITITIFLQIYRTGEDKRRLHDEEMLNGINTEQQTADKDDLYQARKQCIVAYLCRESDDAGRRPRGRQTCRHSAPPATTNAAAAAAAAALVLVDSACQQVSSAEKTYQAYI